MRTGDHCISFIYCKGCNEEIGWVYIKAYEQDQKYKEGKYILEKTRVRLLNKS
ncbi:hypothetical protein BDB01DRAFT_768676 [Pilobolus umbonatus]|nr:hypothetical protein BDB01DRAFT_768676 [Pilobolus umbonatus]